MIKVNRRTERTLLLFVAFIVLGFAIVGCKYFPESTFELANESRLPKWFSLPPGVARSDVSVTMNYYIKPWGRSATFIFHDNRNHVLGKIDGKLKGLYPLYLKGSPQSSTQDYPSFEIITAAGMTEIIEHKRMEPIFYITDSPPVWSEFMGVKPPVVGPVISSK
ncbi:MAG: hypothetical protein WB439_01265 [Acidobacteriaceae bacterium]